MSRLDGINLKLSINLRVLLTGMIFPSFIKLSTTISFENDMYFSSLFGMQDIFPSETPRFLMKRWESYPERLWKMTAINLGILYFKFHLL